MNLLNNHRDLVMVFNDLQGKELHDVKVEVRSKAVPFQESVKAYRVGKSNKRGIVSAEYQGHVSYFEIERRFNNTFFVRTGKKISQTFPINHIISPIFYIKETVQRIVNGDRLVAPGIYHRIARIFKAKPRSGYLVLNKPKFKPYDTLRLKGIVTTRKGKPVGNAVEVYLNKYYPDPFSKKIGTVEAYRKGAYQFEFPLSDSLNLKLDQSYSVEFRDKKGNKLLSTSFRYEEYQLKNNSYSARSERKTKLKPATLYLKGEDSNEMPLFDVRVEILLKPKDVKKYYQSRAFVPDTLWFYKTKLDPVGETKINIPDSVMSNLSLSYEAIVAFYNAENERTLKTVSLDHDAKPFPITIELENDSVKVMNLDLRNPVTKEITLSRSNPSYDFVDKTIKLPYSERVDPFADWYSVSYLSNGETESDGIDLEESPDKLQILSNRTTDSLIIISENPRQIQFRYFLFKNRNLIESSQTESLNIKRKINLSDSYSLSVQYIWAGKSESKEFEIGFDKRNLDIKLDHPATIYPGQKASFKISVQNAFGEPVENVDLTAFAVTKKFETSSIPSLPSFSKTKKTREIFNEFNTKEVDLSVSKSIEWAYWRKTLGLDSIAFYKLLFPNAGYFEHRSKAETSQFAPFVVRRGDNQPIQVIYVDGQPVYYQGVSTMEPYSFHISAGEHTIAIRLNNSLVTISKVRIESNQKLIFSIDRNHLPANCTETEMPFKFSDEELKKLSRYFMVVNTQQRTSDAFLQQGNIYRLIAPNNNYYGYSYYERFVGPFYPGKMTYAHRDGFQQTFEYEPFFSYDFKDGQLKLKDVKTDSYLKRGFSWKSDIPSFKDQVLTHDAIKKYWNNMEENTPIPFRRFPDFEPLSKHIGKLTLDRLPKEAGKLLVRAAFVVNLNNPDNYSIITQDIKNLPFDPGSYQAIIIFSNEQYLRVDSIDIRPYGTNYYNLESFKLHAPDTFSAQVLTLIKKWSVDGNYILKNRQRELQKVRELFYHESSANYSFDHVVSGRIVSEEDGSPLPGVNVIVKGTSIGTVTDMNGYYELRSPANGTLVFSFIGLVTQEAAINNHSSVNIKLQNDVTQLDEVVVTAMGFQTERRNLAASVSTQLSGRVTGVRARSPRYRHELEDSVAVVIRGYASTQADTEPLVILDGQIVRLQDIDKSKVTEMVAIRGPEAIALYGSRASAGVILLSTKSGVTKEDLRQLSKSAITVAALENVPGNSLRKNFRDYAFWKPSLSTDQNGRAEFDATFPDDITGWNAHVLGMRKKLTGQTSSVVKSYKPLAAQIAQPLFLVEGDSANAIGKITNYVQEEIDLERTIKIDQKEIDRSSLKVKDSRIDSIHLTAKRSDTLSVLYSVAYKNYSDGELRKVPVYPQGVKEANGYFVSLTNDTTVTLNFDNNSGKVKLYAQADLLDVLVDEIRFLKNYPYECNEQQASRLLALLLEKKISTYKNERFKDEREISKMIRKLTGNQNKDGSWSWWGTGEGNVWITLHVAKSLDQAQKDGFPVAVNKESLINYLEINLANTLSKSRLEVQTYLLEQGEKLHVKELVDSIQRSVNASLHDKLTIQRLKQLSGETPDWNWINSQRSQTIKGNSYWGEDRMNLSDNSVHNSLLVYKMIEKENPSSKELTKLQNYFLEHRKKNWRNTYESSLILEAILPRLLVEKHSTSKPALQLSGLSNQKIEQFPFELAVAGSGTLTVSKSGTPPVYFTAYQETWNNYPEKSEKDFIVSTSFEDSPKTLKTGKPIKLVVEVEVKNDAEYVMIEVPIPAGCYYESKSQFRSNGEIHREYYNQKTNIYCQYLKKGKYTYSISLLPRYSGSYTINPAVVECMYFPTIYGREGIKEIEIK
ncbi:MAG TPA: carboxypeptidase-like regulatory domain-containing protein [Cyclobacteriaceae bacterium]|nr:carboxypeptidase-like regulatory domain-containing protein [Cyclobacteriaceae bacterium]HMY93754.1 carboxypeptidase-like regulatory domain-containing protein [Cyclobacteriaceae bacterium]HNE94749.1 carboxypeptidase-like regulatory domain-containing protein [Cyclobacteriaceae bacterium]HNK82404.1 carboxypeptidase-like regulatory domain-containing protein [Cyclobacteriaceae bacterium]HNN24227.1 carboxypeptidase-like regulatory domain-containing protein [Cyclobacteriaceae bacterium]